MRTYVTSTRGRTRLAHIGNAEWIACGKPIKYPSRVVTELPANRVLCARCVAAYEGRNAVREARSRQILPLLCEGRCDDEVALMLGIGLRTAIRYVSDAQDERGAMTRLHLGYLLGQEARD